MFFFFCEVGIEERGWDGMGGGGPGICSGMVDGQSEEGLCLVACIAVGKRFWGGKGCWVFEI